MQLETSTSSFFIVFNIVNDHHLLLLWATAFLTFGNGIPSAFSLAKCVQLLSILNTCITISLPLIAKNSHITKIANLFFHNTCIYKTGFHIFYRYKGTYISLKDIVWDYLGHKYSPDYVTFLNTTF